MKGRVTASEGDEARAGPPLKWAGGKRWLVPTLREVAGRVTYRRLVEPFVGGMAVALALRPEKALLNDANPHLINFYRWVREGLRVGELVRLENDAEVFYRNRARFNELIAGGGAETAEAAALFYYLNRTGFNGLCRFNASGLFNVPFGRYRKINYATEFAEVGAALTGWELRCGDFEKIALRRDDLVYADPPYDVDFTTYSAGGFSWNDQVRLVEWLARHRGPVVISNQATERVVELYTKAGYRLTLLDAPRRISCTGDRTPAKEVLATNF